MAKSIAVALLVVLLGHAIPGASADDDGDEASAAAKARFPQPVLVGTLVGRSVLQPLESQPKLGSVDRVVRDEKGGVLFVLNYGGFFGYGARPIAVPVGAMALLGKDVEVVGFTPGQLAKFPTFEAAGTARLSKDEIIRVGLAKPSH